MPECDAYCAIIKYSLAEVTLTVGIKTRLEKLTNIDFLNSNRAIILPQNAFPAHIADQLNQYFKDGKRTFQVDLEPAGTPFQLKLWRSLQSIPSGDKRSYGQMAKLNQTGARAVGNACRHNPIPIIIPCHRVVAKSCLGGYAGATQGRNIDIKRWLLNHELN